MRLIITIALLALSIMMPCIAEPDSVTTGPYKVTFDLGIPTDAYKIEIKDPVTEESLSGDISTVFSIAFTNKTGLFRTVTIILQSFDTEQVIPLQDELSKILKNTIFQIDDYSNIDSAKREIDGHNGAIVSAELTSSVMNAKVYAATYFLSSTDQVSILSTYPWEEGTLQLLKTIHVEKINSTS